MQRPAIERTEVPVLYGKITRLRLKSLQDAANDYRWRTDPELARLDATIVPNCSYEDFYRSYCDDMRRNPAQNRFAIETIEGEHIGNCSFFSVDEKKKQAEVGIMIGNKKYWNNGYGTDAMLTLLDYLFSIRNIKRAYLKTLDWNHRAQKSFNKCGFSEYATNTFADYNFILMECLSTKHLRENR